METILTIFVEIAGSQTNKLLITCKRLSRVYIKYIKYLVKMISSRLAMGTETHGYAICYD